MEVPRPNSSIITKELQVAVVNIEPASNISAIKVDTPFNARSPAPTRAHIQSKIGKIASSAGTNEPICVNNDNTPKVRIYVDLPPRIIIERGKEKEKDR